MQTNENKRPARLSPVDNREDTGEQRVADQVITAVFTGYSPDIPTDVNNGADLVDAFHNLGRLAYRNGHGISSCPLDNLSLQDHGTACRKAWLQGWQEAARVAFVHEQRRAGKGQKAAKAPRLMRSPQQPLPPSPG